MKGQKPRKRGAIGQAESSVDWLEGASNQHQAPGRRDNMYLPQTSQEEMYLVKIKLFDLG